MWDWIRINAVAAMVLLLAASPKLANWKESPAAPVGAALPAVVDPAPAAERSMPEAQLPETTEEIDVIS